MPLSSSTQSLISSLWTSLWSDALILYLSPSSRTVALLFHVTLGTGCVRTHSKRASSLSSAWTSSILITKSTLDASKAKQEVGERSCFCSLLFKLTRVFFFKHMQCVCVDCVPMWINDTIGCDGAASYTDTTYPNAQSWNLGWNECFKCWQLYYKSYGYERQKVLKGPTAKHVLNSSRPKKKEQLQTCQTPVIYQRLTPQRWL